MPGILLFAIGLIPVFSSDRIPRTFLSFACLAAGGIFFFADFKIFPRVSGIKVLSPQFWNPRERDWQSYTLMGSVWFLVATILMISISVLSNFYSARMDHSRLLSHGVINQAKILKKCGNTIHGCLAIDYRGTNDKRYQKSISIDQKFYRKLEDGDSITIVYPKNRPMAAQFTEFDFSIWKPSVPRAWGFILMTFLTLAWFPSKSLFLRIRGV